MILFTPGGVPIGGSTGLLCVDAAEVAWGFTPEATWVPGPLNVEDDVVFGTEEMDGVVEPVDIVGFIEAPDMEAPCANLATCRLAAEIRVGCRGPMLRSALD